jgi:transposase
MARKNYTDDFRRQAVDLFESTPGATLRGIDAGATQDSINIYSTSHFAGQAHGPGT